MMRYPQTVRIWARHSTRITDPDGWVRDGFDLVVNVNVTWPAYLTGRLLGLIDRLDD